MIGVSFSVVLHLIGVWLGLIGVSFAFGLRLIGVCFGLIGVCFAFGLLCRGSCPCVRKPTNLFDLFGDPILYHFDMDDSWAIAFSGP
ncbi:MAG TPA: hypothetical protein VNX28_13065 [Gemmataceae bacterium]|nr:hypothetical protein [Gemmataceae bacterium]